jgi:hypothetical protein
MTCLIKFSNKEQTKNEHAKCFAADLLDGLINKIEYWIKKVISNNSNWGFAFLKHY